MAGLYSSIPKQGLCIVGKSHALPIITMASNKIFTQYISVQQWLRMIPLILVFRICTTRRARSYKMKITQFNKSYILVSIILGRMQYVPHMVQVQFSHPILHLSFFMSAIKCPLHSVVLHFVRFPFLSFRHHALDSQGQ